MLQFAALLDFMQMGLSGRRGAASRPDMQAGAWQRLGQSSLAHISGPQTAKVTCSCDSGAAKRHNGL